MRSSPFHRGTVASALLRDLSSRYSCATRWGCLVGSFTPSARLQRAHPWRCPPGWLSPASATDTITWWYVEGVKPGRVVVHAAFWVVRPKQDLKLPPDPSSLMRHLRAASSRAPLPPRPLQDVLCGSLVGILCGQLAWSNLVATRRCDILPPLVRASTCGGGPAAGGEEEEEEGLSSTDSMATATGKQGGRASPARRATSGVTTPFAGVQVGPSSPLFQRQHTAPGGPPV